MIGLGRILAEAREARGLSLEEVERDTRISRRYLVALEDEDFAAFPAQVQARGFLRLYSQYLALDTAEMLALFPHDHLAEEADGLVHGDRIFRDARPEREFHLPTIDLRRPPFLLAGAFLGVLLMAGALGSLCASRMERSQAELALLSRSGAVGAYRVPDVRDDDLATALATMERAGIRPLVIEVPSERVAAGLVISQTPPPDSAVLRGSDVTLIVSRGRQ